MSFTTVYFAGIVVQILIRARVQRARRGEKPALRRVTGRERASLRLLTVGLLAIPIVYAATDWLEFADHRAPPWVGWTGVVLLVCSLVIFWRGHADLGLNWSPSLELREQHVLVTRGIYGVVRHPMYSSLLLWSLAQPLLLHNWIAGPLGPVVFALFYALRVGPEEQMMLDSFGDRYREYMRRVGGVLPRVRRG